MTAAHRCSHMRTVGWTGAHWLHMDTMSVCDVGLPPLPVVGDVLDNHRVHRDGSFWRCPRCGRTWPFPSPLPAAPGPCLPRRWGDEMRETR